MKFTEEHKAKIAAATKASWTDERKAKLRESRLGEKNPFYGKKHKHPERHALLGESNPFFGKHHSDETKQNLSEAHKGRAHRLYRYGITDEEYAAKLDAGLLWCCTHKEFLPVSNFITNRGTTITGKCRSCSRRFELNKKFGVTPEWFDTKIAEQGGTCALCGRTTENPVRQLCVDHDHATGKVRGILCNSCNTAIERLDNVPDWATKAIAYLNQYRE